MASPKRSRSETSSIAAELTTDPDVHSPMNLNSFMKWAQGLDYFEVSNVMQVVHTLEHTQACAPHIKYRTSYVVVENKEEGWKFRMAAKECNEVDCARCLPGKNTGSSTGLGHGHAQQSLVTM